MQLCGFAGVQVWYIRRKNDGDYPPRSLADMKLASGLKRDESSRRRLDYIFVFPKLHKLERHTSAGLIIIPSTMLSTGYPWNAISWMRVINGNESRKPLDCKSM